MLHQDTMNKNNNSNDKCVQCMNHLTSILTKITSKPKILFNAMGVIPSNISSTSNYGIANNNNNNDILFTMDADGKGVKLQIPRNQSPSLNVYNKNNNIIEDDKNKNTIVNPGFGGRSSDNISSNTQIGTIEAKDHSIKTIHQNNQQRNTLLQRVKTKLRDRFQNSTVPTSMIQQSQLATSSSNSTNNLNNNNNNNNNMTLEIQCRECGSNGPEGSARAFLRGPSPLTIILCTNRLSLTNSEEIDEVLTHELIHVFDVHHRKWDFSNCQTLARSEIRAAREAECGSLSLGFWKESCVRNKAKEATKNMFPYHGFDCVNKVFKDAMRDSAPFNMGRERASDTATSATIATSSNNVQVKRKDQSNMGGSTDNVIDGRSFSSSFASSS